MPNSLLKWFEYEHLPTVALQDISRCSSILAHEMDSALPESAEKTAGLRKLLEAKDCFVRAMIESEGV